MNESIKTKIISFNRSNNANDTHPRLESLEVVDSEYQDSIFTNTTSRVPHVTKSIGEVTLNQPGLETDFKQISKVNKNFASFPKFYLRELKHYRNLVIVWICIVLACFGGCAFALFKIFDNVNINNWVGLILAPWPILVFAFLFIAISNYLNFRSEAKVVDFSKEKLVTKNIKKLYLRLKTGYININWMCGLVYALSGLVIAFNYLVALLINTIEISDGKMIIGAASKIPPDGNILFACGSNIQFVILIVAATSAFVAFLLHIILIVSNYVRTNKIDAFFTVQIVSDEELTTLKKYKNKRDFIIFFALVATFVLVFILIYKAIKKRQKKEIKIAV